jgi:hypothetical protein
MHLVLGLILAQALSTSPTSVPVGKAGTGETRTLADVARERKLGVTGVKGGTLSVTGSGVDQRPLVAAAPAHVVSTQKAAAVLEPWTDAVAYDESWRTRRQAAQTEIDSAQEALSRAEGAMPQVTFSGRGSAAAQALADETRAGALLPYREKAAEASAKLEKLQKEAAKAGVPGLVR